MEKEARRDNSQVTAQMLYSCGISASEVYKCLQAGKNELDVDSPEKSQKSSGSAMLYNADVTPSEVFKILGAGKNELDDDETPVGKHKSASVIVPQSDRL